MKKSKSRLRNKKGQYRISNWSRYAGLFVLTMSILLGMFIQWYFTDVELLNPYVGSFQVRAEVLPEPTPTPNPWKTAKITAYSCNGITDKYHLEMNCPSIRIVGEPRTANGTAPIIDKTMACDPANMGRTFEIEGLGLRTCTDTGGAIKGAGRFDLYVSDIQTAYAWGTRELQYKLVGEL